MKPSKPLLLAAALAFVSATSTKAQLIAYENFGISAGTNAIAGSSGNLSTGFSTNWTTISDATGGNIISPGYTYTGLTTSGNRAQIFNASATPDPTATYFYRTLTTPFSVSANSTGTLWASFIIQATAAAQGGLGASINFTNNNTPTASSAGVSIGAVGSSANYRVANRGTDTSGSGSVLTTTTNAGTQVFAVLKLTLDTNTGANDFVSLWFNPNLGSFNGTEASLGTAALDNQSMGNIGLTSINSIVFGSNYVNTGSPVLGLDEIRLGTTVASVIPEPTTWALLAGSLTALAIFRRRRA